MEFRAKGSKNIVACEPDKVPMNEVLLCHPEFLEQPFDYRAQGDYEGEAFTTLCDSIKVRGILEPVTVVSAPQWLVDSTKGRQERLMMSDHMVVISGYRRMRALVTSYGDKVNAQWVPFTRVPSTNTAHEMVEELCARNAGRKQFSLRGFLHALTAIATDMRAINKSKKTKSGKPWKFRMTARACGNALGVSHTYANRVYKIWQVMDEAKDPDDGSAYVDLFDPKTTKDGEEVSAISMKLAVEAEKAVKLYGLADTLATLRGCVDADMSEADTKKALRAIGKAPQTEGDGGSDGDGDKGGIGKSHVEPTAEDCNIRDRARATFGNSSVQLSADCLSFRVSGEACAKLVKFMFQNYGLNEQDADGASEGIQRIDLKKDIMDYLTNEAVDLEKSAAKENKRKADERKARKEGKATKGKAAKAKDESAAQPTAGNGK